MENNNNNFNEKKILQKKSGMGYCPFVLQEKNLYCRNSAGLVAIQNCIAGWKAQSVL